MKSIFVFFIVVILSAGTQLEASRPIPSYKDAVSKTANYKEKQHNEDLKTDPKGKRSMIIVANVVGPAKTPITIWVYSLEGHTVLGPFVIYGDGELTVPIDNRPWGVVVQCDGKVVISVWTVPLGAN